MKRKPRVGDDVILEILDHAMIGGDVDVDAPTFFVRGVITRETANALVVSNWVGASLEIDGNTESVAVVKTAIVSITYLEEAHAKPKP